MSRHSKCFTLVYKTSNIQLYHQQLYSFIKLLSCGRSPPHPSRGHMESQSDIHSGFIDFTNYLEITEMQSALSRFEFMISLIQFLISITQKLISLN